MEKVEGATKNNNNNRNACFGLVLLFSPARTFDTDGNGFWLLHQKHDNTAENAKPNGENPICGDRHKNPPVSKCESVFLKQFFRDFRFTLFDHFLLDSFDRHIADEGDGNAFHFFQRFIMPH